MNKKVLIISSTPRKGGNSDILCDEFATGAKESGNKVEKVRIADKKISYCTGCYACQKTGTCAIKDDAKKVIDKMMAADVIVLARVLLLDLGAAEGALRPHGGRLSEPHEQEILLHPHDGGHEPQDFRRRSRGDARLPRLLRGQQGVRHGLRFRRV